MNMINSDYLSNQVSSILLIDDDAVDNFIHQSLIRLIGQYNIQVCQSADAALQHLATCQTRYDLILLDLFMPFMDGFKFIEAFNCLNFNNKHGEVCVLTVSIDPKDKVRARQLNLKLIEKPISRAQLLSIL
jgi:CheY-like chemotaxis protein